VIIKKRPSSWAFRRKYLGNPLEKVGEYWGSKHFEREKERQERLAATSKLNAAFIKERTELKLELKAVRAERKRLYSRLHYLKSRNEALTEKIYNYGFENMG
jgi:hypothetical protein